MNDHDHQLRQLLRRWQEIEPSTNFDAQVWRRIRQAEPIPTPSFADWLRSWLPRPALAAAVAAGVVIGVTSGWFSRPVSLPPAQLSFLAPDTLAGALRR